MKNKKVYLILIIKIMFGAINVHAEEDALTRLLKKYSLENQDRDIKKSNNKTNFIKVKRAEYNKNKKSINGEIAISGQTSSQISDKFYTIQLAAFTKESEAKAFNLRLRSKNIDGQYSVAQLNRKTWYRVQVGQFKTVREARVFEQIKIKPLEISAFVTPMSLIEETE